MAAMLLLFLPDIPSSTPLTSPLIEMPPMHTGLFPADRQLQQQIASLKHQQQMQQQMLLEQFHEQQRQLAQQHEKQLQEHIKVHMVHCFIFSFLSYPEVSTCFLPQSRG